MRAFVYTDVERFHAAYAKFTTGCWVWMRGRRTRDGYGKFWFAGRRTGAHIASYVIHNGRWPNKGQVVMHSCDNPRCVNPAHLSAGTPKDNTADMMRKGRGGHHKNPRRGERSHLATLKTADVHTIRDVYQSGAMSQSELGVAFGVGQPTIFKLVHRQRWRHV